MRYTHTQGKDEDLNYVQSLRVLKCLTVIIVSLLSDMCYPQPSVNTCLPFFSTKSSLPWCYTETPSPPCRLLLFHMETKWVRKKKKQERGRDGSSVTVASLLKQSNCLFKCCHGESQWQMAHLFFPFELSSWIFSPVDRFHSRSVGWDEDMETENPGGSLSF